MAAIDYGTGPNTTTGDTMPVALGKLRDRLLAAGFDPGLTDAATIAVAVRRIEATLDAAEEAYVPPVPGTPTPTPSPAPVFTVQPSISPASGAAGTTFTATDGSASNATGYTRRWLLGGTSIGTGSTVVPVTAGALSLEVTATGPGGSTIATSAAVTVSASGGTPTPTPGPTLNALSVSPSSGTVGTPYSGTISGRTAGSTTALAGAGAAGLSLSGTTISGTPTTAGAVNITETLSGATNSPRSSTGTISVVAAGVALAISGTPAPATVGSSDTFAPTISGGAAPYTLSLLSGTLPPGRTVNGSDRTVAGTYTTAGTYTYVLRATDSVGATADLTVNLTVAAAATPAPSPPAQNQRVATTQAYDSASNTTLVSALAANNARPTYTLTANTARTIAWKIGAVADPGGYIAYIVDKSGYTAVAEQSVDSTNGVDGTWTRLTDALVFPAGGTSSQGAADTRQLALVPTGAGRWVRLTLTHTASANVFYPAVYQRPASGNADVWVGVGASNEGYSLLSKLMEDAIIAAYPGRDPVFLRYANGGTTVSTIKDYGPQLAASHWQGIYSYVLLGNIIGNDISNNQPIDNDSQATLDGIRANVDTSFTSYPGKNVFAVRTTFRGYTGVRASNQAAGALPYNARIIDPAVAANLPISYDASLGIPRIDLYSAAMRNRAQLDDEVHFLSYTWMRDEYVQTVFRYAYTGAWPLPYVERQVALAETAPGTVNAAEAQYAIDSLPASSAKTALQSRLNAVKPAAYVATPQTGFVDTFDYPDGDVLTARGWEAVGGGVWAVSGSEAFGTSLGGVLAPWTPTSAAYEIAVPFRYLSSSGITAVMLRYIDESNYYWCGRNGSNGDWTLWRMLGGVNTALAQESARSSTGTLYDIIFRAVPSAAEGTVLSLRLTDGTVILLATDNSAPLQAKGRAGMRQTSATASSTARGRFQSFTGVNL